MAEQVQRFRQYEYRANSNLVLTTDLHRPRTDEPSGEPESLKDHLSGKKFGDRYAGGKPQTESSSKRSADHKKKDSAKRAKKESENVLSLADDMDTYRPRTKETRTAYETLLTMMQVNLGAQPHDILRGAADEVLACLKNDSLTDPERKREIEKLINEVSPERFGVLVSTGKKITDYLQADGAGNEKLDDELGVAVVFDEDDDVRSSPARSAALPRPAAPCLIRTPELHAPPPQVEEGQRKDEEEVGDFVNEEMSDDDDGGLETRAERQLSRSKVAPDLVGHIASSRPPGSPEGAGCAAVPRSAA